jgi:hypothetical protein
LLILWKLWQHQCSQNLNECKQLKKVLIELIQRTLVESKNAEKIYVENTGETVLGLILTHRSPPTPSFLLSTKVAFTNKSKEEQADFSTSEVRKYEKYGEVQKSACFSLNKSYFSIFHQQSWLTSKI